MVPRLAEAAPEVADRGTGSVLAGFLLSFLIFGVGWVVLGVATLRTRVFPRWTVILLIVGPVLAIRPFPSRALVLEVAVGLASGLPFWPGGRRRTGTRRGRVRRAVALRNRE